MSSAGIGPGGPPEGEDDDEILDLAEHFSQVDLDGDRRIDFGEFARLMQDLDEGIEREAIRIGFHEIDTDRDGAIDFHEFVQWWRER
jgi:calmodulin